MHKYEEKEQETSYDHIIKYTGVFGGVQGVNLLVSIIRNKLASMLLGPSGLGLVSLYNTASSLLGNATNFGVPFSAVRHISELYEKGDRTELERFVSVVRGWSLLTALLGILVCCLCAPFLSHAYFDDTSQWLTFLLLSPAVGLAALSGGELAILKGIRWLKRIAIQSLLNSLFAVALTIPLYYIFGKSVIVLSLVLVALSTFLTTIYFSLHAFPISSLSGKYFSLTGGEKMIKLGLAFVFAGILGSGVDFVIRTYLMQVGSEAVVGLYNAGYVITFSYASIVFVAMETDYFPRLSAVNQDVRLSNDVVNRQIEVSLLLISPLLVGFLVFLPILVPLLYTSEFLPVIAMAQCALLGMYVRAVALPIAYMSLAKGRSRVYLFTESLYDVVAVILVISGYSLGGLRGTGIALALAALFDLILVWLTCRTMYGFRISIRSIRLFFLQISLGILTLVSVLLFEGWYYWLVGCGLLCLSALFSFHVLKKETSLLQVIRKKIVNRFFRKGEMS